jgi:O-methyltransferase domain
MAALLAANPDVRGVVFDLPRGGAEASRRLADAAVAARCEVIAGDFFRSVPEGADAYILKNVIHDWNDDESVAILKNCRSAMHQASRLLLVERVMPDKMEAMPSHQRMAMLDMNMLAMPGGRERTLQEYRTLLTRADLSVVDVIPLSGLDISLIVGEPCRIRPRPLGER